MKLRQTLSAIMAIIITMGISLIGVSAISRLNTAETNADSSESTKVTISRQTTAPMGDLTHNGFRYMVKDGEAIITRGTKVSGDVVVPSEIDGYPVTKIAGIAFGVCDEMTKISIPASVKEIADNVFEFLDNLEYISVDSENLNYSNDENGILYNKDKTELIVCPRNIKSEYIYLPETVKTIESDAFKSCDRILEIHTGDFVEEIKNEAFSSCENLKKVVLGKSVETLGDTVFEGCQSLEKIVVDEDNENYFSNEDGILFSRDKKTLIKYPRTLSYSEYIIPEDVEIIDKYAFCDSSLSNVVFGENFTEIKEHAFENCDNLSEIKFSENITTIGSDAFAYCDSIENVVIPDNVIYVGSAFSECCNLKSIYYGKSVSSSDAWNYSGCSSLEKIEVSPENKNLFNDEHFVLFNKDKTELIFYPPAKTDKSYTVPDSVLTIGMHAFFNCYSLNELNLGNSVEFIWEEAIMCNGLNSITIPKSVERMGEWAVGYCTSLARDMDGTPIEIPNFKIFCYADTEGLEYAIRHGFDYEIIGGANEIEISVENVSLNYKQEMRISAKAFFEETEIPEKITYKSSNTSVATVDENGNIKAVGEGNAIITATINGTDISDTCEVVVTYTWWQWLIRILLLGFLWY